MGVQQVQGGAAVAAGQQAAVSQLRLCSQGCLLRFLRRHKNCGLCILSCPGIAGGRCFSSRGAGLRAFRGGRGGVGCQGGQRRRSSRLLRQRKRCHFRAGEGGSASCSDTSWRAFQGELGGAVEAAGQPCLDDDAPAPGEDGMDKVGGVQGRLNLVLQGSLAGAPARPAQPNSPCPPAALRTWQ